MKASPLAQQVAIIQQVLNMTDPAAIAELKQVVDAYAVPDGPIPMLSEAEEAAVLRGRADIAAGRLVSEEEFWLSAEQAKNRGLKKRLERLGTED